MSVTVSNKRNASKVLSIYKPFFQNNITLLNKAKAGLEPEAVFDFMLISHLPNELIEVALNKSMKTFQNYRDKKTVLDAITSEKLLTLFALYNKGNAVFGSLEAFTDWLSKPAYGIGNQVPHKIIDTITGINLINDELTRIEYGDLA